MIVTPNYSPFITLRLKRPTAPVVTGSPVSFWGPIIVSIIAIVWGMGLFVGFQVSLGILTAAGFAAALAGARWPWVGTLGIGALCVMDGLTRFYLMSGGLLRWNTFNYLLILMLLLYLPVVTQIKDIHSRILAGLLLLMAFQLPISSDVEDGVHTILSVVSCFGILLYFLRSAKDPAVIQWLGWTNGMIGAAGGAVFYMQMDQMTAINHNAFSAFPLAALFSICLAYPLVSAASQFSLGLLGIVNILWIFLTGSRGGMLMAIFCLIFLANRTRKASSQLALFLVAPLLAALTLTLFSGLGDYAGSRVTKLFDDERSMENRTSGRNELMAAGLYLFQNHPLGVGTGGFGNEFEGVHLVDLSFSGRDVNAHSAWIKILAENGLPGIILLAAYVLSFAAVRGTDGADPARSLGLLVAIVLAAAFVTREFQSKSIWLLTASFVATMSPVYARFRGSQPDRSGRSPVVLP
jgi:O-antigen ligase